MSCLSKWTAHTRCECEFRLSNRPCSHQPAAKRMSFQVKGKSARFESMDSNKIIIRVHWMPYWLNTSVIIPELQIWRSDITRF